MQTHVETQSGRLGAECPPTERINGILPTQRGLWDKHTGGTTGIVDAWQSLIPRVDLWSLRGNLGENPELEIRSRQVDKNFKLLPNLYKYSALRTFARDAAAGTLACSH